MYCILNGFIILLQTEDSGSLFIPYVQTTGSQNMEKWSSFSPLDQRKYMVRISVSNFIVSLEHFPYIVFHFWTFLEHICF